jgi:uncharacterized membrane protein YgdD (TMEM256/DUF423 family)
MNERQLVIAASLLLLTGVVAGAFGAHALKAMLTADRLAVWQTAVLYQLVHGLGMLGIIALSPRFPGALLRWAARLMLVGTLIFSGSLYVLVLSDTAWLGAITPLGGLAFIGAWALVATAAYRAPR